MQRVSIILTIHCADIIKKKENHVNSGYSEGNLTKIDSINQ